MSSLFLAKLTQVQEMGPPVVSGSEVWRKGLLSEPLWRQRGHQGPGKGAPEERGE